MDPRGGHGGRDRRHRQPLGDRRVRRLAGHRGRLGRRGGPRVTSESLATLWRIGRISVQSVRSRHKRRRRTAPSVCGRNRRHPWHSRSEWAPPRWPTPTTPTCHRRLRATRRLPTRASRPPRRPSRRRAALDAVPEAMPSGDRDLTLVLRDLALHRDRLAGSERATANRLLARAGAQKSNFAKHVCVHWSSKGPNRSRPWTAPATRPRRTSTRSADHRRTCSTYAAAGYRAPRSDGTVGGGSGLLDIYLGDLGAGPLRLLRHRPAAGDQGPYATSAYCAFNNDYSGVPDPHAAGEPRGDRGARALPRRAVRLRLPRGRLVHGGDRDLGRGRALRRRQRQPAVPRRRARWPSRASRWTTSRTGCASTATGSSSATSPSASRRRGRAARCIVRRHLGARGQIRREQRRTTTRSRPSPACSPRQGRGLRRTCARFAAANRRPAATYDEGSALPGRPARPDRRR